ncbi:MAG: FecR domain-containing protein [Verrucomicrobia bacterium]|nr:FecR domain-containing protein [Verrucomicrobiota bacterium]
MPTQFPESSDDTDAGLDPIELTAAEWLVRRDRGLNPAQEVEFARWLAADERHSRMFGKLTQTWGLLDQVPAARVPLPSHHRRSRGWVYGTLAAAAALTVAFVALDSTVQPAATPLVQSAGTPVGGFEKIDLPDGSVVHLNTASAVKVAFTTTERRVLLLHGEANFTVAKDRARPFVVRAGPVDVRAVGTVFNVRCDSAAVEVLVTEGKVRVEDAASGRSLLAPKLTPAATAIAAPVPSSPDPATDSTAMGAPLLLQGHRLTIPTTVSTTVAIAPVAVAPDEAARALAWQSRRLEFSAEPLTKVVAEFNRYNRHQLVIEDSDLGTQRFGGKFPAHDIESFVRLLELNFGVAIERRESTTVLRRKPTVSPRD